MKKIFVLMLLVMCIFNVTAQTIDQIRSKADAGDAYSQYLMGWSYANGANGVNTASTQALFDGRGVICAYSSKPL